MKRITAFGVAIVIAYVSMAFIETSLDFTEWPVLARAWCIALSLVGGVIIQDYVRRDEQ